MTSTQNAKPYNVLFLCTGNSARSIMAEALLNTMGKERFAAYSAGSHPGGRVNPLAIEQIRSTGYPEEKLRCKSWDEFAAPGAPKMDFIITVCDNAAGEVCPIWPGQPISAHWGFEDPAAATGTEEEKRAVFSKVARQIAARVNVFNSLPFSTLEKSAIKREMDAIGANKLWNL
ncbi:MAG: protein-tyrosine-phosphatase [Herbaspirillum sp.]|nr:protein-tyrosine-phosphatase [Herbaspirillum sp.]